VSKPVRCGRLDLADFESPESGVHGFVAHLFHKSERMQDNSASRVLDLMTQAGFRDPQKVAARTMFSGPIAYFQAGA
jgi:hypothetical protein